LAAAGINKEDEVRKLSMQLRYFEETAENLQQRLSMLSAALTDLNYAGETLENVENQQENADMLVPIGGSSYINVKLASNNKVVVGLGAGVSVEKTVPEAKIIIKERMDELQKTHVSVQEQLGQIAERISSDRNHMETLLAGMKAGSQ
jgi:prefoldin alpha subunit